MPKQGRNSPVTDEQALEMVSRTVASGNPDEQTGAVQSSLGSASWERFVEDRIGPRQSNPVSTEQMAVYERGRRLMFESLPAANVTIEENIGRRGANFRFRDPTTGRFISRQDVASRIGIFSARNIRND
tara:strand:- start:883 stop:1269 length:387 start_codon:yes stop_codon:yes gene_type:complete